MRRSVGDSSCENGRASWIAEVPVVMSVAVSRYNKRPDPANCSKKSAHPGTQIEPAARRATQTTGVVCTRGLC